MNMTTRIATLNLCLGLKNKKDLVKHLITENKIDILCLQETEIEINIDHKLLSLPGFNFESEIGGSKSRVGTYVNSNLNYIRRPDLEGVNSHLVIIDVKSNPQLRIINIYRSFCPPDNQTPREFFKNQLGLLKIAINSNTILMGDFNLDWNKKYLESYQFKNYFVDMEEEIGRKNLTQLVNFATWSRIVNGMLRESTIDHIYVTNPCAHNSIGTICPYFGDHLLVFINYDKLKSNNNTTYRRNWKKYEKGMLNTMLSEVNWDIQDDTVQGFWNTFENNILDVIDQLIPMSKESLNGFKTDLPQIIKSKINRRRYLLKKSKHNRNLEIKEDIKNLNREIRNFFHTKKNERIRKIILPGNTQSLWKAVKVAKDVNTSSLPSSMHEENVEIEENTLPDRFASFYDKKVKKLLEEVQIDDDVYNGRRKVNLSDEFFMDFETVKSCMLSLKSKNSEGFDRIPQKILTDGASVLSIPMYKLMRLIYYERKVPDQWLVAKTIPVFKNKGNSKDIENYRPIANLCSSSKVFEKLILKRILDIQEAANIDLTGEKQHGFKRNKSTSTLSVELLSQIARALDDEDYVIVASIDLSSAFDLVNINLLLKRLKIIGLPNDLIELISVWLRNRLFM